MTLWDVSLKIPSNHQNRSEDDSSMILSQNHYSSSEYFDAERKPGNDRSSVVEEEAGRQEGGASMGRYPFLTWVERYLAKTENAYAESTVKEVRIRYSKMEKDLKMLVESGEVTTTNPEKMNADDVLAYIGLQRKRGLKDGSISHNITVMNSLLFYVGNSAVHQCKVKYPSLMPKKRNVRMDSMKMEDFHRIVAIARNVEESD